MSGSSRAETESTVEKLIEDVDSWPGVTTGEHRFGGTEWRVGPREIQRSSVLARAERTAQPLYSCSHRSSSDEQSTSASDTG
ncbi:luciferase family protein [Halobellus rarus]|uniref:Luciferase family protein n=1 Tax=Halobellus rarus TaxID=1126237 RepID=A0ABD6CRX6_9EURY